MSQFHHPDEVFHPKGKERETLLRLNAIIENAMDGIITFDEMGIIESMNPAAAKLFGCKAAEAIGHSVGMLLEETYGQDYLQIKEYLKKDVREIIGGGRALTGRRKDGVTFPFRFSLSEVKIGEKRIFTGILHDLTEQKLAEKKMWQEKERANQYLTVANTLMVALDRNGNIVLFNKKGEELLGYSQAETIGQNWFELFIPEAARENVKIAYQQLMNEKNPSLEYFEGAIVTKEGRTLQIAWHNSMIYDAEGQIDGTLRSGNDVTQQKKNEAKLSNLNEILKQRIEEKDMRIEERDLKLEDAVNKLIQENKERKIAETQLRQREEDLKLALEQEKELNEMKSRFVSMASHEFRTPLSTILSSAALLSRYTKEDQQPRREKHIKKIRSAVQNLNDILQTFLSYSKLEEGKVEVLPDDLAFNAFCEEILDEMKGLLQKGQTLKFTPLPQEQHLRIDSKLLKNTLINLLSNAIKYSPPGKPVFVKSSIKNAQLKIQIIDQGIGIPKAEQSHLFTRFFRAKNATNIRGTGLGLTIVSRYLHLMNGSIEFESEEGKGTTFTIKIPV